MNITVEGTTIPEVSLCSYESSQLPKFPPNYTDVMVEDTESQVRCLDQNIYKQ